ncbi:putative transcription factor WD40-like family [Helianthus anomalus]
MELYEYGIPIAVCLFQQASSNVTVSKDDEEEAKRGFTSAVMLPSVDMWFVGVEGQFIVVATSVRVYDLGSMSCSYVLAGHTDIVLCLDMCTTSSGRTLIVTGSKDNTMSSLFLYVWALTVGKKTEMLATCGSDAVINIWHDSTAADKEDAYWKEEESVLKSQELENVVLDANYTKAIHLAFELCRPHKLFELFDAF